MKNQCIPLRFADKFVSLALGAPLGRLLGASLGRLLGASLGRK